MSSSDRTDLSDSEFVPRPRTDYLRRSMPDGTAVAWAPDRLAPVALDQVASVLLDVVDGQASIGDLAREVQEEVGVDAATALSQVRRVVHLMFDNGLLTLSDTDELASSAIDRRELFVNPQSH